MDKPTPVDTKQLYCANCFQSFCLNSFEQSLSEFVRIPPSCPEDFTESDSDTDSDDDDESISPIFQEDPDEVEEQIIELIDEWMRQYPIQIWRASIYKEIVHDVSTMLLDEWSEDDLCEEDDLPEIKEWVKHMVTVYFNINGNIPPRQGGESLPLTPLRKASIANKLRILSNIPTPPQRTQEWYEMRYGLLTASNVWKAIGTESQQNQLIVEKCQPFEQFKEECSRHGNLSSNNPMAWGQKYEPISALIYESKNRTKLGEYGCILHPEWKFLGASPDGINIDPNSEVYGRMVEIKNIVNRNIDGIPLDAYWVQMQIQMEVCDLEECDFVETRIKEYASKEEFYESSNQWKGLVVTFVPRITIESTMRKQMSDKKPFYEYFLLDQSIHSAEQIDLWVQSKKDANPDYVLSSTVYWGLDQYSCVLVKRNRIWFDAAIPNIEKIWHTIEHERVTGCEHRAPKKREPKTSSFIINKMTEQDTQIE
jgi:putative phage-type endonuclease